MNIELPTRSLDPGMGEAVGRRTVFRSSDNEDMDKVAHRVATGNLSLVPEFNGDEYQKLRNYIRAGVLPLSGRHLQHGDEDQPKRNMEVFTNCSTAPLSFPLFKLLLNGSGVGRSYDDDLMIVNWDLAPKLIIVLSEDHPDYPKTKEALFDTANQFGLVPFGTSFTDFKGPMVRKVRAWVKENLRTKVPKLDKTTTEYFKVPDTREGWAQAMEIYEAMAFHEKSEMSLVLEWSEVRENGAPIGGMQSRPASGPLSPIRGMLNIQNHVVGKGMLMWEQAMYVDHYTSVEVQVGGARRAARMSTKYWKDPEILKFIRIKADNGLWTSNNSVMVDKEFWARVKRVRQLGHPVEEIDQWAFDVFQEVTQCSYFNGEPGLIDRDKLDTGGHSRDREHISTGFSKYQVTWASEMMDKMLEVGLKAHNPMLTNPCGEIQLHVLGGYCVIGDVLPLNACPYDYLDLNYWATGSELAQWDEAFSEAARLTVRFLMRVNLMDCFYHEEVKRTNRIGVSLTGIHEYAWARFKLTFNDLVDESKSQKFWDMLEKVRIDCEKEAAVYAEELGVNAPHTVLTIKPAGTTSKLYGVSEGAHLPARRQYLRWVQFKGQKNPSGGWKTGSDPLLKRYEGMGYPIRELTSFPGMSIVGFPTVPMICRLMPQDQIITAPEASPEDQYRWIRLIERYWIGEEFGNQVSYTLKIFTNQMGLDDYRDVVFQHQPTVRCCSVMPCKPDAEMGYEYLPEQEVTLEQFDDIVRAISDEKVQEDIDLDTLQCASGACPI